MTILSQELPAEERSGDSPALKSNFLPLWKVVALGLVGQSIGQILALSAGLIVGRAGNGSWLSIVIAFAMALAVAEAIAVFARRYVATGSLLSYVSHALGPWAESWTAGSLLIGYVLMLPTCTMSTVVFSTSLLVNLGVPMAASPGAQIVSIIGFSLVALYFGYRGIDASIAASVSLGVACVPVVLWLSAAAASTRGFAVRDQMSLVGTSPAGLFSGTLLAVIFYVAFDGLSTLAAETRNPLRDVPRALRSVIWITGITATATCLLQAPTLLAHAQDLAAGESPLATLTIAGGFGRWSNVVDALIVLASMASTIAMVNYGARVVATAATDGYLPRRLAHIHPHFRSPARAAVSLSAVGAGVALFVAIVYPSSAIDATNWLNNSLIVVWSVPYVLICIGAMRVEARNPQRQRLGLAASAFGACAFATLLAVEVISPFDRATAVLSYAALSASVLGGIWYEYVRRRDKKEPASVHIKPPAGT
jgi:amino acid transporter